MKLSFDEFTKGVGYLIALGSLLQIVIFVLLNKKSIIPDLKGKDGKWQLVEISAVIWYILFPALVVCDLMGVHATTEVWTTLDAIYVANLTKLGADKYIDARYGKPNENNNNQGDKKDEEIK